MSSPITCSYKEGQSRRDQKLIQSNPCLLGEGHRSPSGHVTCPAHSLPSETRTHTLTVLFSTKSLGILPGAKDVPAGQTGGIKSLPLHLPPRGAGSGTFSWMVLGLGWRAGWGPKQICSWSISQPPINFKIFQGRAATRKCTCARHQSRSWGVETSPSLSAGS